MNNTAAECDGLNQLASASVVDDDEASEQLLQALSSTEPFPINLAWIVPLLSYKHISSLTTHLKRHFEQDEHFQKYSSGGARTHTYKISIYCFREICQYARHSQRRALAQYWIKVIDDVAGGDFKKEQSKLKYKKIKSASGAGSKKRQASATTASNKQNSNGEDGADDLDDDEYNDSVDDELNSSQPLSANNSFNESDDGDIESKSTSLLSSLSSHHQYYANSSSAIPARTESSPPLSVSALYNYNMSASTPPKPRVRKDFTTVSILNRKRKAFDETTWKNEPGTDDSSNARPNLRLLSELALGLR
jgi:hypothetical protein